MKTHQSKIHVIHMIDCIYLGQLNTSYQKDGFGIQQTFNFDSYIGYWKSNKAEGLGLAILENGTKIYANFIRDQIDGLAIIDDGERLQCGIYRNHQIVGVGFTYDYQFKLWKMNRYHKGVAIQVVKQQQNDITNTMPKLINVQQSIYFHMYNYLNKNYFPSLQMGISQQLADNTVFYGHKNSKGSFGPGLFVRDFQIIQAGFYQQGDLHGFGFKRQKNPLHYQFGCYNKGRKDGPFLQKDQDKIRYTQYRKNILLKNLPNSEKNIFNNQKKYNFNCKDFFSSKNSLPFQQFKILMVPPQIRDYNAKKYKQKDGEIKKKDRLLSPQNQERKTENKLGKKKSQDYIIRDYKQKSSLQIIRQKVGYYNTLVNSNKKRNQISSNFKSYKNKQVVSDDDQIAKQQNPFIQN